MGERHDRINDRRRSIITCNTALAQTQGYGLAEARERAIAQEDLDEAFTARQLTITEGLTDAGWSPADWTRICHGTIPTDQLLALVSAAKALPRPGVCR